MLRPVLAASIALALVACRQGRPAHENTRPAPVQSTAAVPAPVEVRPLGRVLEHAAADERVQAFDGVSSIPEGAGALWLLNSFTRARGPAGGGKLWAFDDHAALYTSSADWTGRARTRSWRRPPDDALLVPLPAAAGGAGRVVRLLGGMADGTSRTRLFHCVARPLRDGATEVLGVGVATWSGGLESGLQHHDDGGDWRFFGRGDPLFGVAVVQADMGVTTGFDYVFGVRGDAARHRVYLARVPHGRLAERGAYRFLARSGEWAAAVQDAAPLFEGADGGLSVAWNPHLQAFLAVYSRPADGALRVLARAAGHPTGPWSAETTLLEVPPRNMGDIVHGAREHGHLAEEDGRVVFVSVPTLGAIGPVLHRIEFP